MEGAVATLSSILTNIGSVVTSAISWMGDYLGLITKSGNEILFIFCVIPLVGLGVGLVRRMMNIN